MRKTRISHRVTIILFIFAGVLYMLPLQYFLSSPSLGSFYSMIVADGGVAVERRISYGPHPRHKLDIYRPVEDTASGPIVLFIYGGSWREGDRALYGFVGAALAHQGITTIIPDYRLYPEVMFPTFIEDAAKAYAWSFQNIASAAMVKGHKARPIILMGHSAGAHIAALMTLDKRYLASSSAKMDLPAALIGLAGPMSFDPTTDPTTKDVFANVINADIARPVSFVRRGLPPALLIHGLDDTTVQPKNSRDLAKALSKADVDVCKLELPDVGHVGLVLAVSKPLRWRAPVHGAIVKFINNIGRGQFEC